MPSKTARGIPASNPILESAGFQELYHSSHLAVFRYIYALHGGPGEEVEDLTALTYLKAWKSRRRFEGDLEAALGWLLVIARNLVIDSYRKAGRRGIDLDIDRIFLSDPALSPEQQVVRREQTKTLWNLLADLPVRQLEIIVLRYILGWRVKDIAAQLAMKENTVSVTIRRTLHELGDQWPNP